MVTERREDGQPQMWTCSSKQEYENVLTRLARAGADEEYEKLAEEYVRFCDKKDDAE